MNTLHISTERLILKPHTQENLKWLNTLFNDVDEQYYDGDDPPKETPETLEETARLLHRILNRPPDANIIDYAIHRKEDDALIGCGMIAHIDPTIAAVTWELGLVTTNRIGAKAMPARHCKPSLLIVSTNWI